MLKSLERKLIANDISPTAMRLLVFDFFLQQNSAISLADLEKNMAHSDRSTLYRTLKTFQEKGLIHSIEDGSGATRYALCEDGCEKGIHHDLHVHFFCNRCKETCCLPKTRIPEISLPENFAFEEVNLVVKGICSNCA